MVLLNLATVTLLQTVSVTVVQSCLMLVSYPVVVQPCGQSEEGRGSRDQLSANHSSPAAAGSAAGSAPPPPVCPGAAAAGGGAGPHSLCLWRVLDVRQKLGIQRCTM